MEKIDYAIFRTSYSWHCLLLDLSYDFPIKTLQVHNTLTWFLSHGKEYYKYICMYMYIQLSVSTIQSDTIRALNPLISKVRKSLIW